MILYLHIILKKKSNIDLMMALKDRPQITLTVKNINVNSSQSIRHILIESTNLNLMVALE